MNKPEALLKLFLHDVSLELPAARAKFTSELTALALAEEAGEAIKAAMDEPRANVWKECVQTAAMAARLALDGDDSVCDLRRRKGLDALGFSTNPAGEHK